MFLTVTDDPDLSNKLIKIYRSSLYFSFFVTHQEMARFVEKETKTIKLCIVDGRSISTNRLNKACEQLKKMISGVKVCVILKRKDSDRSLFLRSKCTDSQIFEPFSSLDLTHAIESLFEREKTSDHSCITLCVDRRKTRLIGYPLHLTPSEHRLLALLLKYPQKTFSAKEASSLAYITNEASVSVHVCAINKKAAMISQRPLILSKYGLGYYINPNP